jgi:hypothetical protein
MYQYIKLYCKDDFPEYGLKKDIKYKLKIYPMWDSGNNEYVVMNKGFYPSFFENPEESYYIWNYFYTKQELRIKKIKELLNA